MDLDTVKDTFVRAAKKPKVNSYIIQELIDRVEQAIKQVLDELQPANDPTSSDQKSMLTELRSKLNEIAPMKQLEGSQKAISMGLVKYTKLLEKEFNPDISKACRTVNWDIHTLNKIIACHFYKEGLFDVGDSFLEEACLPDADSALMLRSLFLKMHNILMAMRSRDLKPALSWAVSEHDRLMANGSNLGLKLHQLQFLDYIQKGRRSEALVYAKTHLAPFASTYKHEIQRLLACLLWAGRLDESPYADLTAPNQWEALAEEVGREFCGLSGEPWRDSLGVAVAAGFSALPTLLKMASVAAVTNQKWGELKELPTDVDLPNELQFHTVFVCPVSWERTSKENPPMLLPCGHVLCKQAIVKMAKSSTRHFKCPLCPNEATLNHCRQLYF